MKKQKAKKKLNKTRAPQLAAAADKFLAESKHALGGEALGMAHETPLATDAGMRTATAEELS